MNVTGVSAGVQAAQTVAAVGYEAPPSPGGFLNPTQPNIVDFLQFINTSVQIPPTALPPSSPWPQYALAQAIALVLTIPPARAMQYVLACYNAGTHILLSITPDQSGQTYFTTARSNHGFSLVNPLAGLVQSSSDQGTSNSLVVPEFAHGLTIGQLDFYRTPYGRYYLNFQQSYGPTIVALS